MRFRASPIQPGTTSSLTSQDVSCSKNPLISFRTQLSNIRESVSKTHDAVMIQKTTVDSVLQSLSGAPRCHTNATNEPCSNQYSLSSGAWCKCPSDHDVVSRRLLSPEPMTPLEGSQNFFAESYTVNAQILISCLVAIASFEQVTRDGSRTNVYRLFHLSLLRRWQWLTVSVQIPCSSRYWAATKIAQRDKEMKCEFANIGPTATLPYSLLERIQVFLCQGEKFSDNTKIDLFLSERDTAEWRPQILRSDPFSAPCQPLSTPCEGLTYLHGLGCRRYDESEVLQIKIVDPPNFFCSSLNGLLVYEVKFKDSIPAVGLLYTIRVLHCMNDSPGFTKLIGIITDNSRRYLKSYLIELPKPCRNILQIAADPSVPWERREQWAAHLVRGISRLHAHSFLVGGLCTCNIPLIDDRASVQFWSFKFVTGRKTGAYYPPECLYIRDMPPCIEEADSPKLTSKTDIFHLGLMLWLLAENKLRTHASPVCSRMGCNEREKSGEQNSNLCDLSHAEPIVLPRLPESIPRYFRNIVDACRRTDPSARPAAREILEMFPSLDEEIPHHHQQQGHGQSHLFP